MLWLPLVSLSSMLLYQATNPALYYLIGLGAYFWAYTEGEVSDGSQSEWLCGYVLMSDAGHMCGTLDITQTSGTEKTAGEGIDSLRLLFMMIMIALLRIAFRHTTDGGGNVHLDL